MEKSWNTKFANVYLIYHVLSVIHKTVPTVPGRGSRVPAHHNRLISPWVP